MAFCLLFSGVFDLLLLFHFSCQEADLTNFFFFLLCDIDMHDLRLIHTDLKPENILLVSSENVKVATRKVFGFIDVQNMHICY